MLMLKGGHGVTIQDDYVMPHSHFDYGGMHPQAMLRALQKDYLDQAIELVRRRRIQCR